MPPERVVFLYKEKMAQNPGLSPNVAQAAYSNVPLLNQVSPSAPMSSNVPQVPLPSAGQNMQGVREQPQTGMKPTTESEMIVKALVDRLKLDSKAKEALSYAGGGQYVDYSTPMGGGGGFIEQKVPKLISEGYPRDQAVAIAYNMKGSGGGFAPMQGMENYNQVSAMSKMGQQGYY